MAEKATLHTNMGDIVIDLFPNHAPKTVANFVELATGQHEWTHPKSGKKSTDNLYDGTIFHRVISGFMIQGGDPAGNGTGGPGYKFADEFHPELVFDRLTYWRWPMPDQEPMVPSSLLPLLPLPGLIESTQFSAR